MGWTRAQPPDSRGAGGVRDAQVVICAPKKRRICLAEAEFREGNGKDVYCARCTLECKWEALKLIGAGESIAAVAARLGPAAQTPHNWMKAWRMTDEQRFAGSKGHFNLAHQLDEQFIRIHLVVFVMPKFVNAFPRGRYRDADSVLDQAMKR